RSGDRGEDPADLGDDDGGGDDGSATCHEDLAAQGGADRLGLSARVDPRLDGNHLALAVLAAVRALAWRIRGGPRLVYLPALKRGDVLGLRVALERGGRCAGCFAELGPVAWHGADRGGLVDRPHNGLSREGVGRPGDPGAAATAARERHRGGSADDLSGSVQEQRRTGRSARAPG